jgi:hypothetical protein
MKEIEELEARETRCYTYEVSMVIQIFARDEAEAKERLDRDGGYISHREVKLKDSVYVYSGKSQEPEKASAELDKETEA